MNFHLTREQGQALLSQKKPINKYNAKRVLLDGICFDSKAEANYYAALKLREKANEVTDIELQRWYDLIVTASSSPGTGLISHSTIVSCAIEELSMSKAWRPEILK